MLWTESDETGIVEAELDGLTYKIHEDDFGRYYATVADDTYPAVSIDDGCDERTFFTIREACESAEESHAVSLADGNTPRQDNERYTAAAAS